MSAQPLPALTPGAVNIIPPGVYRGPFRLAGDTVLMADMRAAELAKRKIPVRLLAGHVCEVLTPEDEYGYCTGNRNQASLPQTPELAYWLQRLDYHDGVLHNGRLPRGEHHLARFV